MSESKPKLNLMVINNRNFTLTSTKGHSIKFEKGVPVHVPPAVLREALEAGAEHADGASPVIEEHVRTDDAPADPTDRAPLISKAIEKLVAENERDNFTAAGAPAPAAVSRVVGFKVQAKEIAPLWQLYHDIQADTK